MKRKGVGDMRLSFIGAAHEVTGSCHLLEACGKNILIDCGMEQGPDLYENQKLPVSAGDVDYVLLTHAHIDHSGNLPLLCKQGFQGDIVTTFATADLCSIMLRDSAHIQEFEAEWRTAKAVGRKTGGCSDIYDGRCEGVLEHFAGCDYNKIVDICPGLRIRFTDVGHLLGSSCIEIWISENGLQKRLSFPAMWETRISR
mgnify:CR=1 FL=1